MSVPVQKWVRVQRSLSLCEPTPRRSTRPGPQIPFDLDASNFMNFTIQFFSPMHAFSSAIAQHFFSFMIWFSFRPQGVAGENKQHRSFYKPYLKILVVELHQDGDAFRSHD